MLQKYTVRGIKTNSVKKYMGQRLPEIMLVEIVGSQTSAGCLALLRPDGT